MQLSPARWLIVPLAIGMGGGDATLRFSAAEPSEALGGGQGTVGRRGAQSFLSPSANLSAERRVDFSAGNSFFRNPWVIAPASTTARDGLGPLFNANACQNCHVRNGRGHSTAIGAGNATSMLVRLSIPPGPSDGLVLERFGAVPEPVYGIQLQDMAIPGVNPEGKVRVEYRPFDVRFADGFTVQLRQPTLNISQLGYGPMHPLTQFSVRVAPPMIGLGLLEAISESAILANARAQAEAGQGVLGRTNQVWDEVQGKAVIGRFGWKAGQPTLEQQNAHAFAGDMGLTSALQPVDHCTPNQRACRAAPNGHGPRGEPEVNANIQRLVLFYTRQLGVPARTAVATPHVLAGKQLFYQAGCQTCHVPRYTTAAHYPEANLAGQVIRPYTDLLLHDMGPGLADQRSEFLASGRDWRTPPLWGLGLTRTVSGHSQLLHDGRARNILEAVLWHGGEAASARRHVLTFNATQRDALLAFLESL